MADLFPPDSQNAYEKCCKPVRVTVAEYHYVDELGALQFVKFRFDPKDFVIRYPRGKNAGNTRRVLFRLDRIAQAALEEPILFLGGEKACLAGESLGWLCTCLPFGEGNGLDDPSYAEQLRDRHIILMPDNDRAGFHHVERLAGYLMRRGVAGVRIVELPGLEEGEDLFDWVERGGTNGALTALVNGVKEWRS